VVERTPIRPGGKEDVAAVFIQEDLILVELDLLKKKVGDAVRVAVGVPREVPDAGGLVYKLRRDPRGQIYKYCGLREDVAGDVEGELGGAAEVGAVYRGYAAEFVNHWGGGAVALLEGIEGGVIVLEKIGVLVTSGHGLV